MAAVVVTFNRPDVLRTCLAALRSQTRPLNRIIVVDNGSEDETAEMIATEFPSVRLVAMGHNSGAAGGFAAGLSEGVALGHDWIWMFNDDDVPHRGALATMLGSLESLPGRTGIVGCARHDEDGTPFGLGSTGGTARSWWGRPLRPAHPSPWTWWRSQGPWSRPTWSDGSVCLARSTS